MKNKDWGTASDWGRLKKPMVTKCHLCDPQLDPRPDGNVFYFCYKGQVRTNGKIFITELY